MQNIKLQITNYIQHKKGIQVKEGFKKFIQMLTISIILFDHLHAMMTILDSQQYFKKHCLIKRIYIDNFENILFSIVVSLQK